MKSVGDGFDHALGERFFATLEGEWIDLVCLHSRNGAAAAMGEMRATRGIAEAFRAHFDAVDKV